MSYIFHSNNYFTLIDSSPKNGVFCQIFSSSYTPKAIPIHSQHTTAYSAHMDENGKIYVATMPDDSHLNYYIHEGNRFKRYTLVSNANSNYHLASPVIYTVQNIPYMVYLSHQSHSETYNFVQENLAQPELITLMTCYTQPTLIKHYATSSKVLIFFVTFNENYQLNALEINQGKVSSTTYLTTSQPISDYSVCMEDDLLHISYVSELHGKYQLSYFNTHSNQISVLTTTQYPCLPAVFCFCNLLWINAIIGSKLQMLISIDNGKTFSIPVPCSLQNNIHRCHFLTHKSSSFVGQEVYASITSNLKLCTLYMIDLPGFHLDTMISPELELLLEGLMLSVDTLSKTPAISPTLTPSSSKSYEVPTSKEMPSPTRSTPSNNNSSIDEAKNAFMNELSGWELPPLV